MRPASSPPGGAPLSGARRILVMRYRFIGDSILLVPFLKNLRRLEPAARIDLLVAPFSGQILAHCPYVDRILPFAPSVGHRYDPGAGAESRRSKWRAYLELAWRLRAERYDSVFVLKRSLSSALLGWVSGARVRAGFATEGRRWLLTHPVPYRPQAGHEAESFLEVLRGAGYADVRPEPLELWTTPEEEAQAAELLAAYGLTAKAPGAGFALVHAAASTPGKQWEDDRFVEVCMHLWRRRRLRVVFTGGPTDRSRYETITAGLAANVGPGRVPFPVNLCGRAGLRVDLAIYRQARLFVGVDSGPMHMAVACGVPVVALFGPTDPAQWGPYEPAQADAAGRPARPVSEVVRSPEPCGSCRHEVCPDRRCMRAITTAAVLDAIDRRLAERVHA